MTAASGARAELEALLAAAPRVAGDAPQAPSAVRERRAAFLASASRRFAEVHAGELAKLSFLEAQLVLGRTGGAELGLCGLRSEQELRREADALRARVVRAAAQAHGAPPEPRPEGPATAAAAIALLERSLQEGGDGVVRAALGLVLAVAGEPVRALRLLDEPGASATPRAASRTWEAAACALDRSGRPDEAARAYARAAEADPSNAGAALFALYFALEHGDARALDRAVDGVGDLRTLGDEGRDVIDLQRRALASGAWRPTSNCLERAETLRSTHQPHLDHVLEVLVP